MYIKLYLYTTLLFGVTWFAISNGTELNSNEDEAQKFALKTSDKIFELNNMKRSYIVNDESPSYQEEIISSESMLLMDIVQQAKKFDFKNFKNKELKYAFEIITKLADVQTIIGAEQYIDMLESINTLIDLHSHYQLFYKYGDCNYDPQNRISNSDALHVIASSDDLKEVQFYWNKARIANGYWAEDNLNLTLNGLKDAANLSDVSPLEFWLRGYNLTEIENLITAIQPLYMELHAFIRNGLLNKYGDSVIKSDGLIPHHLFQQVMGQIRTNKSIIEAMFPYKKLPTAHFATQKIFSTPSFADVFYEKLGFSPFPNEVWKNDITIRIYKVYTLWENVVGIKSGCRSNLYYKSPKIYLKSCPELNFQEFLQTYSDMGKLYYAKEMTGLPAYFFSTYDLEYAIGKAAILSASTHSNLKAIGMILEFDNKDEVEMNRLLRKSFESLLNLAVEFVHIKLTADLLAGNVEQNDLNNKYWELMDKYVGVKRPPMKQEPDQNILDMPADFYFDMNDNKQSRKFISEVLSYQIYKKLCELSGKYPKESLHLCDIFGSKAAGDALKNMMRLGSSKPFNEVLATMFPENPTISAEGILEYYSPVKEFLIEKNSQANVKPGWKHYVEDDDEDDDEDLSGKSEPTQEPPNVEKGRTCKPWW